MAATGKPGDKPAKPFSISFGTKSKPLAAKVAPKKRSWATLTEDDSDDEQDAPTGKVQLVHSFDQAAGGAIGGEKKEPKGPLVITAQKNLDWREEARRRRGGANLLPAEEQARRAGLSQADPNSSDEKKPVYGLLVADRSRPNGETQMPVASDVKEEKVKTADEEAIEALLGEKKSDRIIEQVSSEDVRFQTRTNDADTFRADIASRPESASLADYEAVPIEDFGLALLRGQGYKPGDPIGRRKTGTASIIPRVPQKRPNLLGIGAKPPPEGLEELGAWGKGARKNGPSQNSKGR